MDTKILPPHPRPSDAAEFLASLTPRERELHEMATEILGSSYFMDRCHGYRKWAATAAAKRQVPAK
jgi:hypothetical protein